LECGDEVDLQISCQNLVTWTAIFLTCQVGLTAAQDAGQHKNSGDHIQEPRNETDTMLGSKSHVIIK